MSARDGRIAVIRDAWAVDGFAPVPGDTLALPDGERVTVETVYLCSEPSGDDVTRWTWIVLADGRLSEVAPRGCALYEAPRLLKRGTGRFLELTAQDGALVRFEERVRAGTWEDRPVRLTLGRRRWRLTSTGTATAQRLGPVPETPWGQLGTRRASMLPLPLDVLPLPLEMLPLPLGEGRGEGSPPPADEPDVYFTLAGLTDAETLGLGLWATDVILAFGRRLGSSPDDAGLRVIPA
jgi:hypothetical protein